MKQRAILQIAISVSTLLPCKGIAQYFCSNAQIGTCGTTDTIPQNAIVVNPSLVFPSDGACFYICNSGYLKLIQGAGAGFNTIYIEPFGSLDESVIDNTVENQIIAKFPSTINLIYTPLNIKCDSGVIVNVGGQPMNPYPCTCHNTTFDNTYIGNCPVGIDEAEEQTKFSIFPNPASTFFSLTTSAIGQLTIKNELGQLLQSITVSNNRQQVSTSMFPSGIYFLTFQTGKTIQTKKLLIHH
ncbi:MAG: T9SS type A sorting domain-containing protein [Chitinophagales bacterium]